MKEIGGFFEWEMPRGESHYPDAIELNSGRNCLAYVIRALKISKIAVPAYTCPVVWEVLEAEGCEMEFYQLGPDFLPDREFNRDDFILYTNYFGLCTRQASQLAAQYQNLIVDCAQAFYCKPLGIASLYSPRKFFGLPDGGLLMSNARLEEKLPVDDSMGRVQHLIKRLAFGAGSAYAEFRTADDSLDHQPVMQMSPLTHAMLRGVDYERASRKRIANFDYLHQALGSRNEWTVERGPEETPMVYPLLIPSGKEMKKRLIERKIFVATYWAGQRDEGLGARLEQDLLCLPVDQRYGPEDMNKILEVLDE